MTIKVRYLDPELGERELSADDIAALGGLTVTIAPGSAISGASIDGSPIGATTPAAIVSTTFNATGLSTLADVAAVNETLSGLLAESTANALTAAGTTRADALALTKQVNHITTAAAGTGVVLPALTVGQFCFIFNDGASPVQVYGAGTTTVDGAAAATGVPLTNALRALFLCVAANTVISAQLGVVSA